MKFKKPVVWDEDKNQLLRRERGVSFEEASSAIKTNLLAVIDHPNQRQYAYQKMFVVEIRNYAYLIPFVENAEHIFLKTIFPSRKATQHYLIEQREV